MWLHRQRGHGCSNPTLVGLIPTNLDPQHMWSDLLVDEAVIMSLAGMVMNSGKISARSAGLAVEEMQQEVSVYSYSVPTALHSSDSRCYPSPRPPLRCCVGSVA